MLAVGWRRRRSAMPRGSGPLLASPIRRRRGLASASSGDWASIATTSSSSLERPALSVTTVGPTRAAVPPSVSGEAYVVVQARAIASKAGPATPDSKCACASDHAASVWRDSNRWRSGRMTAC